MSDQPTVSILVVRHAEKPTWQRAGALAAWLGSVNRKMEIGLELPRYLFTARPTNEKPSVRSLRTLQPLANALGLAVALEFAVGGRRNWSTGFERWMVACSWRGNTEPSWPSPPYCSIRM